jgi:hypothetical protein
MPPAAALLSASPGEAYPPPVSASIRPGKSSPARAAAPAARAIAHVLPLSLAALLLPAFPGAAPGQTLPAPATEERPAPPDPALAPPAPARLQPDAPPWTADPLPRPRPSSPLPGLEPRADGGWRLRLPAGGDPALPAAAQASLGELGRRLAAQPQGRITVIAQVSGPATDVSAARRLSLARGIAVKEAMTAGGLAETRIDIRPAGRTAEAVDAVDVLPPGVPVPAR